MYDEHGNLIWEEGENRQVDLSSVKASKVLVEDDGWNNRSSQAKVNVLATPTPLKQASNLEKEIDEFAANYSGNKVKEASPVVKKTLKRDDSKFTSRFREENERTDREVRRISAKEYARNVVANSPSRPVKEGVSKQRQQSPIKVAKKESAVIIHDKVVANEKVSAPAKVEMTGQTPVFDDSVRDEVADINPMTKQ